MLREYEYHPEAKCAGADGNRCGKQTVGLLQRRRIAIDGFGYIGKESNKLEQVEEGGVPAESDVYTIYNDPWRDKWEAKWLPMLQSTAVPKLPKPRVIAGDDLCYPRRPYIVRKYENKAGRSAQAD